MSTIKNPLTKPATPIVKDNTPLVTVSAEQQNVKVYKTLVSDIQENDVVVANGAITGTLKYLDTGAIPDYWGAGHFLVLKFTDLPDDPAATSIKVGLDPSVSSGLVELLGDPDMNGVFKITNKAVQKFVVETTIDSVVTRETYDLSELETLTVPVLAPITSESLVRDIVDEGGGGGSVTVDTEMSDSSTNAVQNKIIKAYVDEKALPNVSLSNKGQVLQVNAAGKWTTGTKIELKSFPITTDGTTKSINISHDDVYNAWTNGNNCFATETITYNGEQCFVLHPIVSVFRYPEGANPTVWGVAVWNVLENTVMNFTGRYGSTKPITYTIDGEL